MVSSLTRLSGGGDHRVPPSSIPSQLWTDHQVETDIIVQSLVLANSQIGTLVGTKTRQLILQTFYYLLLSVWLPSSAPASLNGVLCFPCKSHGWPELISCQDRHLLLRGKKFPELIKFLLSRRGKLKARCGKKF